MDTVTGAAPEPLSGKEMNAAMDRLAQVPEFRIAVRSCANAETSLDGGLEAWFNDLYNRLRWVSEGMRAQQNSGFVGGAAIFAGLLRDELYMAKDDPSY